MQANAMEPAAENSKNARPAKLIQEAELTYPEAAREQALHGDVIVVVDVNERGDVTGVEITEGHVVFHDAAVDAARRLKFEPALVRGEAVATRVRVFFHFVPPLNESEHEPIEVIVHGADPDVEDIRSRTTLAEEELEKSSGDDLAETLTQVAGVHVARGTGDTSKPIIRGQNERRLLVLFDGIRHEGQKWGPDHPTEIDPFSAGSISVIRGASGARYGPDAMGGVILVEPPPMRTEEGIGGKVLTAFASNGTRPYGAFRLDGVASAVPNLSLRLEGNYSQGAALRSPNYVLGNTASTQWNAGAALQYRWAFGHVQASYRRHDLMAGIFYGVQSATPDDFNSQLELGRPVTADLWTSSFEIDRPYQDVSHDIALLKGEVFGSWGRLTGSYSYQHNHREEYERARESIQGSQYDFTLRTHAVEGFYQQPERHFGKAHLEGGLGVQGSFQENVYSGLPLLPNYRAYEYGVFALERLSFDRLDLEVGGRYDQRSQTAFLRRLDFEKHTRRDTLNEEVCEYVDEVAKCPDGWQAVSVSAGALVHLVPEMADLKLDFSTASRFPDLDEQYLIGSAPSFPVFGLGYPDLDPERTVGGSVTMGVRRPWLEMEISGYSYNVANYVFFSPVINADGTPHIDVTVRGAYPSYDYQPIEASIRGADGSLEIGVGAVAGLQLLGSMVRQRDVTTREFLTLTPPDRLRVVAMGRPAGVGPIRGLEFGLMADFVAEQTRTNPSADFGPPPPAYQLLGAYAGAEVSTRARTYRLGVEANNLLNTVYRDYTSLLRYYADQPGRDIQLRLAMDL